MKKLLTPLIAAAALAAPATALAWGGGHDHHGVAGMRHPMLTGTGTSFGASTATAQGTGFKLSLSTTWSSTTSKTFTDNDGDKDDGTVTISCAPATASITLGTNAPVSLTGRTCSLTRNGTTKYGFMGRSTTGLRAAFKEDGTTVTGFAFAGFFRDH